MRILLVIMLHVDNGALEFLYTCVSTDIVSSFEKEDNDARFFF